MAQGQRPVSPHLQIYRWYPSMAFSILHRITGSALAVGLLLLTWWLVALARGPESFAVVQGFMHSFFGFLILFGFSAALFFHAANGVRHLIWDAGYGLDKASLRQGNFVMAGSAGFLTVVFWLLVLAAA